MTCPDELASLQARLQGSAAMHLAPGESTEYTWNDG